MSTRAQQYDATVRTREQLSDHLVRLTLDGLAGFASTGIPDEWVGLVVPGQFQSRYYTVRRWDGELLTIDVVVHAHGLVTEWASGDCVGDAVVVTEPRGSFAPPPGARWLRLVGDLTALPAIARIAEETTIDDVQIWVETPERVPGYLPEGTCWLPSGTGLADLVSGLDWPEDEGYFWMAGESAQMRAIRKHLMREVRLPGGGFDVMGYWRATAGRQPRAVDPGPIYAAGRAAGKSDEEIWADYDAARQTAEGES